MDYKLKNLVFKSVKRDICRLLPLIIVCVLVLSALSRDISFFWGRMPEVTVANAGNLSSFLQYRYTVFTIGDFYDIGYRIKKKGDYTDFYVINNFGGKSFFVKLPYRLHNRDIKGKRFIGRIIGDDGLKDILPSDTVHVLTRNDGVVLCAEVVAVRFMLMKIIFIIFFLIGTWSIFILMSRLMLLISGKKYFLRKLSEKDRKNISFELQIENRCLYAEGENFLFLKNYAVWLNDGFSFRLRNIDGLIWVYVAKKERQSIFFKKKVRFYLTLCFIDGKCSSITMPNEDYAENLLNWLYERYPIVAGYSSDVEKLFKYDPEKIKKLV